jgi:hypothetical protein
MLFVAAHCRRDLPDDRQHVRREGISRRPVRRDALFLRSFCIGQATPGDDPGRLFGKVLTRA